VFKAKKAAEKQMVLTAYFVFKHELCEKHQPTIAPSPSKGISWSTDRPTDRPGERKTDPKDGRQRENTEYRTATLSRKSKAAFL